MNIDPISRPSMPPRPEMPPRPAMPARPNTQTTMSSMGQPPSSCWLSDVCEGIVSFIIKIWNCLAGNTAPLEVPPPIDHLQRVLGAVSRELDSQLSRLQNGMKVAIIVRVNDEIADISLGDPTVETVPAFKSNLLHSFTDFDNVTSCSVRTLLMTKDDAGRFHVLNSGGSSSWNPLSNGSTSSSDTANSIPLTNETLPRYLSTCVSNAEQVELIRNYFA